MTLYASAPSNIALVKYWGKRETRQNLPLTSSFSVTLDRMRTWVAIDESKEDRWTLHGDPKKAMRVLEEARRSTGQTSALSIHLQNDFPSGAGLASSASSMAALAFALDHALTGGKTPLREVARWARLGSGSAVRSLYGGYVLWHAGHDAEGRDCYAETRFEASAMPLSLVVCVANDQPKPIGSTAAMERCRDTSPRYEAFHARNPLDIESALAAVQQKDLHALARISEENCLAMHEVMHTATPPIDYFLEGTHAAIAAVRKLREEAGIPCFFTIDAGPNVKVFCPPAFQAPITEALRNLQGIKHLLHDQLAPTAARLENAWPATLPHAPKYP